MTFTLMFIILINDNYTYIYMVIVTKILFCMWVLFFGVGLTNCDEGHAILDGLM